MVVLDPSSDQMLAMDVLAFDKMKGNRRKQSKPIRVSCSADSESAEPGSKFLGTSENEFPNNENDDVNDVESRHTEDNHSSNEKMELHAIEKELDMRRKLNDSDIEMKIENNNKILSLFHNTPNAEGYPTKYHRLGSELFQPAFPSNGDARPARIDQSNVSGEDRFNDMRDKILNSDEEGKKVEGGNRIFHQDAYCEICDREFCNKYFLKTHRANKHGIFDNSTSPVSATGLSLPQDTITTTSSIQPPTLTTSSSFKVMDFIQNLPATEPKAKIPEPPKPVQKPESKSPLMPQPPSTPTTPGGSSISNSANVSSASKPVSKDMEDFCELCQKHFCNKYYLKKHKQDVHGIAPPDGSSTSSIKRGRPKDLQAQLDAITSSTMSLGNPTSSVSMSSFMPPHSLPNMPGLPNMPPGVMVLNPFMAPMLLHAGGLMPGQGQMPTPPIMAQPPPPTSPTPPPMPTHSSANSPPPTSLSGQTPSSNGVLNAEAFCDLCQKEFCNKYFLKIHRANKHGVFFDDFPFGPPIPPYKMPVFSDNKSTSDKTPESANEAETGKQESSPKAGISLSSNSENSSTYCNLCNQEFASKYTYRIHRIQIHGMLNEAYEGALMEDIMLNKTMKDRMESQMKISPNSLAKMEMDEYFNNRMVENGMSTMFSNMVAAKLADRVTCDICNKVLCNKYFLKVHKQKVHGVEPTPEQDLKLDIIKSQMYNESSSPAKSNVKVEQSDVSPKMSSLGSSFPMSYPKSNDVPYDMSPNSVEKPSKEELVKMGIDPEAYCEICKKEFCSKYFLRTHKQNIHGIRGDKPETPESDKMAFINMQMNQNNLPTMSQTNLSMAMNQNNKPLNLSMNSNNLSMNGNNLSLSMNSNKKAKNGYERHSWRWKEPVNSSRVICELCNKEVCNKYFLRTHKLNKHGILPSETSLSPSRSSPHPSEFDTQSNSSLPTDLSMKERNQSPFAMHLDSNISRPSSIYGFDNKNRESEINDNENSDPINYYNSYSEVCHLCEKRFKNLKRLKQHIMKDHGFLPTARKGLFSENEIDNRICRMCNASFPNELAMHLHMIQEHNAQVSLNTNENERENMPPVSRSRQLKKSRLGLRKFSTCTKQKYYSCSHCDFRSKWLNNLCDHELSVHNISPKSKQTHGNVHVNASKLGKYKCSKCSRKFPSAILCNRHIREEHIRKKDFAVVKSNTRFSCEKCSFSTRFAKQLKRHVERVHSGSNEPLNGMDIENNYSGKTNISEPLNLQAMNGSDCEMQAFKIKDCSSLSSDFVTSVVQMPVRHHVRSPITVTFHLTPMEQ